jgi:hypothetical protein
MKRGVISLFEFNRGKWKTNLVERLDLLVIQINLGALIYGLGIQDLKRTLAILCLGILQLEKENKRTSLKTS